VYKTRSNHEAAKSCLLHGGVSCFAYSSTLTMEVISSPKLWMTLNGQYGTVSQKTEFFKTREHIQYNIFITKSGENKSLEDTLRMEERIILK
jgi:hypothetical protein